MKIVINKCYGGFGLSAVAVARYAELTGRTAYFFDCGYGDKREYVKLTMDEATKRGFFYAFDTPDVSDSDSFYKEHSISVHDMQRNDSKLVQVVEELGAKANGSHAELQVVEIPDHVEWEIEEYDGIEWVAEKHQTWSHRGTSGKRRAAKALYIVTGRKFR